MTDYNKEMFSKILSANDEKIVEYEIKEWDMVVYLHSMSSDDRIDFAEQVPKNDDSHGQLKMAYKLIAICMRDKEGKRIVPVEEADLLGQKDGEVVNKLARACNEACGLSNSKEDISNLEKK